MPYKAFTTKQLEVLRNCVGAVESGGTVYGNRDYGAFAGVGANTPNEISITLGWAQWYGENARNLLKEIQKANPTEFKKLDTAGIAEDLNKSWARYDVSKTSVKGQCLIKIISSPTGKQVQDKLFDENMEANAKIAYNKGVEDKQAQAMACNWIHQGGPNSLTRILKKTNKPYNLDNLYAACCTDSQPSQVGSYKTRQKSIYNWLKQYWPIEGAEQKTENTATNYGGKAMISNSGKDENNSYRNGQAGDQTGHEWELRAWYSYPWDAILRFPDTRARELFAELSEEAAANDKVGYDQYQRTTYWNELKKVGYRPSKITTPCEADCSAGVAANWKAVGYLLGISKLMNLSEYNYTGSMKQNFAAAGFQILTDTKYRISPDYLLRGDVLICWASHTCANLTNGSKSGVANASTGGAVASTNNEESLSRVVKSYAYVVGKQKTHTWYSDTSGSLTSYPTLDNGTRIGVCSTVIDDKTGKEWYYFCYNNKYGFIEKSVTSTTKPGTTAALGPNGNPFLEYNTGVVTKVVRFHARVIAGPLNFRVMPGTGYQRLTSKPSLASGDELDVCDCVRGADGAPWYYVAYRINATKTVYGFVSAQYIKAV